MVFCNLSSVPEKSKNTGKNIKIKDIMLICTLFLNVADTANVIIVKHKEETSPIANIIILNCKKFKLKLDSIKNNDDCILHRAPSNPKIPQYKIRLNIYNPV
ncbi:hypothetical protein G9F71_025670 [Clostridium sp. FP2]|uniref:hypothetical protein n=1 Tax=Clostridium sp. FP2 TaxID=2724481 RepID=UPI0013E9064A|nr:hypothetical protein [Clostridium sp. FP2]MBZ9626197.1 hypothetical protein [Clostridium sp. FP2]